MTGRYSAAYAAFFAVCVMLAAPARAGDAGHAWGTISNPGQALLNSAAAHAQQGSTAGIVDRGAGSGGGTTTSGFPAVTSCGTCTTTIQGNNNSISGTSITSSNTGVVTSTGTFNGH